jgi:hypothetical protein
MQKHSFEENIDPKPGQPPKSLNDGSHAPLIETSLRFADPRIVICL